MARMFKLSRQILFHQKKKIEILYLLISYLLEPADDELSRAVPNMTYSMISLHT